MALLFLAPALAGLPAGAQQAATFDVLILGGEVLDGTGAPRVRADVGIRDGRIAAIGDLRGAAAGDTLDAAGLVVAPGFIDLLMGFHYEQAILGPAAPPLVTGSNENSLQMGVTTGTIDVEGGQLDKAAQRAALERTGTGTNLALFFPLSTAWAQVVGESEQASPAQMERLRQLARTAMEEGAFGIGTAIAYCPSCRAPREQLIEVVREAAPFGGYYASHIRNEDENVTNATQELIAIAEGAGVPGHILHMKVAGAVRCGQSSATIGLVRAAQARGLDVSANQYPYTAGQTGDVGILIPDWAEEGSEADIQARFRNPATRGQVVEGTNDLIASFVGSAANVSFMPHGTTLEQEAQLRRVSPGEAIVQMRENQEPRFMVVHFGCDHDLRSIMQQPWVSIATDDLPWAPSAPASPLHPRAYGTYPRVLGQYVREEGWLTLEEAVRKSTGQPAARLGLVHADPPRGLLREGWAADVVVFDPVRVIDRATYEEPALPSEGIEAVLVNGVVVKRDGAMVPLAERATAQPGVVLRHTSEMPSQPQPGFDLAVRAEPPARGTPVPAALAILALAVARLARRCF